MRRHKSKTRNHKTKQNRTNSTKSKILLTGITLSSALVMSRPIIPAAVYAATNKYDWTKQEDLNLTDTTLTYTASSASGANLIAGMGYDFYGSDENITQPNPLYISSNYGVTWANVAETIDPEVANQWSSVDISNDGQIMVAASSGGYDLNTEEWVSGKIIMSQNGGTSWSDIAWEEYSGSGEPIATVSGDGSTLAVAHEDSVFVSEDGGDNWTSNRVVDDEEAWLELGSLSVSDNGDKLLAGKGGSGSEWGEVFISEDSGDNWVNIDPEAMSTDGGSQTAMSADGSKIAVAGWNAYGQGGEEDGVYVSSNHGATWTDVTPDDLAWNLWGAIDMSADGNTLAVFGVDPSDFSGSGLDDVPLSMYVSSDFGGTWTAEDPTEDGSEVGAYSMYASDLDLNSTGSRVILGSVGGVYTGHNASLDGGSTVTFDDAEGGKTIALSTPDGTTITCHEAVKESGLAATDNAYTHPLGLIDFCFSGANTNNEISIVFVTDLKPNQVVARKYNTTNSSYSTLNDASITETTLNNQHALQVTYNLSDNGPLDLDPNPGSIKDPVGLATQDVTSPNTGLVKSWLLRLKG